jgi:hypothetical protein
MIGGSANKVVVPTLTRSYVLYAREDRKQHIAENIIKKHFNHPNSDITLWHGPPGIIGLKSGRKRNGVHSECGDGQAATDSGFEPFMILEDDIDVTHSSTT